MIQNPLDPTDMVAVTTLAHTVAGDLATLAEIMRGQGVPVAITDRIMGAEHALNPALDIMRRRCVARSA